MHQCAVRRALGINIDAAVKAGLNMPVAIRSVTGCVHFDEDDILVAVSAYFFYGLYGAGGGTLVP